jgi:hypothetical protein
VGADLEELEPDGAARRDGKLATPPSTGTGAITFLMG